MSTTDAAPAAGTDTAAGRIDSTGFGGVGPARGGRTHDPTRGHGAEPKVPGFGCAGVDAGLATIHVLL